MNLQMHAAKTKRLTEADPQEVVTVKKKLAVFEVEEKKAKMSKELLANIKNWNCTTIPLAITLPVITCRRFPMFWRTVRRHKAWPRAQ